MQKNIDIRPKQVLNIIKRFRAPKMNAVRSAASTAVIKEEIILLDILIKNANIIDGSGKPAYRGNVGVKDGKLVLDTEGAEAAKTIDAAGRCLAPGFIDAHSHGDMILGSEDAHLFKTTQGVTTEIVGQCGLSMAPVVPEKCRPPKICFPWAPPGSRMT